MQKNNDQTVTKITQIYNLGFRGQYANKTASSGCINKI